MGAADVVPGVSGGTIAFVSGIYDELIESIKGINIAAMTTLLKRGPVACWHQINGNFLLVLFAGIATSIFSLAKLISYLLENHPVQVWSFFFGLILASVIYMFRQQSLWGFGQILAFLVGTLSALFIAFSPPLAVTITPPAIFFSGMLAICAMILPGISGSFILLLLGIYPVIIAAISSLQLAVLGVFAAGAVAGLLVFSRLLSWLLHRHRATTLSVLIGFLTGSLVIVWPWQHQVTVDVDAGVPWARELMLPSNYGALAADAHLMSAILLMGLGIIVLLGLEFIGKRLSTQPEKA